MAEVDHEPRSRRYWENLVRFAGACIALGLVAIAIYLIAGGVRLAAYGVHPPRASLGSPPSEDYENVSFVTSDGLTLRGWYIASRNKAAVILGHGHAANRAQMLSEASILARQGYGVLLFDWRAHGESDGDTSTLGDRERQDLEAAIKYVAARQDVDPEKIGSLGFSMGAATVTLGAAQNSRLRAVVIEAAYPTLEEEIEHRFQGIPLAEPIAIWIGQRETGSDISAVRPVDEICAISPRPVLLIYGTNDSAVPSGSAEAMFAAACEPKELWLIEGAEHGGYANVAPEEYERRLIEFFDAAIGSQ